MAALQSNCATSEVSSYKSSLEICLMMGATCGAFALALEPSTPSHESFIKPYAWVAPKSIDIVLNHNEIAIATRFAT